MQVLKGLIERLTKPRELLVSYPSAADFQAWPVRAFGFVLASLGVPQGIVND
jgi:hypothetical protein